MMKIWWKFIIYHTCIITGSKLINLPSTRWYIKPHCNNKIFGCAIMAFIQRWATFLLQITPDTILQSSLLPPGHFLNCMYCRISKLSASWFKSGRTWSTIWCAMDRIVFDHVCDKPSLLRSCLIRESSCALYAALRSTNIVFSFTFLLFYLYFYY